MVVEIIALSHSIIQCELSDILAWPSSGSRFLMIFTSVEQFFARNTAFSNNNCSRPTLHQFATSPYILFWAIKNQIENPTKPDQHSGGLHINNRNSKYPNQVEKYLLTIFFKYNYVNTDIFKIKSSVNCNTRQLVWFTKFAFTNGCWKFIKLQLCSYAENSQRCSKYVREL